MSDQLKVTLTMRVADTDRERLTRATPPLVKQATVARLALRIGLAAIEADPAVLYAKDAAE